MSNFAPAAENAIKVIEGIATENEPVGITELSRKLNINKNMIFRILNSLEESGWVYAENAADKKYSLTLKPFAVASKALNRLSLNNAATPLVHELWRKTGESTYLGIKSDDKVIYIQHFDSTKAVKVAGIVGGMYELHNSAPGKVILAYSDDDYIKAYASRSLKENSPNTITEKKSLLCEIEKIKTDGYAVDNEEFSGGILCLAAPIFDYTGNVIATVGCSVSTLDFDLGGMLDYLKPLVCDCAKNISERLGYTQTQNGGTAK